MRTALAFHPRLIWLDPGIEVCLENCRARPWGPHKHASAAEQNQRLPALLEWLAGYDERDGELGRAEHRQCFLSCNGMHVHWVAMPHRGALAEMPWG
ncbi:MAG: hypothetical protein AB1Z22_10595 [Synechococcaceae cyanobacterium]